MVSVADAIRDASPDWLLDAGTKRLGGQCKDWPFLLNTSAVVNNQGKSYAESFNNQTSPGTAVVEQLADFSELLAWGHVLDSWRYLSHAAIAILHASRSQALHFAYYAELRATLGILAASGITILHNKHYSITATGELRWFGGGTNPIAFEALKEWVRQPANAMSVITAMGVDTFAGIPWLDACRASSTLTQSNIAQNWLDNWSFDLSQIHNDKDARNEATYRPDLSNQKFVPFAADDLAVVNSACRASLLSESNGYTPVQVTLVNDLCRASAGLLYTSMTPEAEFWANFLPWLIDNQGLTHEQAQELAQYVQNSRNNDAGKLLQLTDTARQDAYAVFARAFFLLQLASFLLLQHQKKINQRAAAGNIAWAERVLHQFGLQAHLWSDNNVPGDLKTITADAESASDQLMEWESRNAWSGFNLWRDECLSLVELCKFERHFVAMAAA